MPRNGIETKSLTLWVIFLFAFGLRIWGNTFGLPYFFHPDEQRLILPALDIVEKGQWNPGNFIYPTGFIYLLFFGFKLLSVFGLTLNHGADLVILHWLGRFYSALFGAGTVWLVYGIGKKAYNSSVGMAAALFLSVNFIHLRHSHYATTDITTLFFILLSLFFVCHCEKRSGQRKSRAKSRGNLISLAALFGGIATGVKYNAWPIIFPLLIVSKKKFIHTMFFYILGFFLTVPFAFIDLRHFLGNFIEILIIPHSKWLGITHPGSFYYFYGFKPIAGVGAIFILSLLGLFFRLKNWSRNDTIFISFFLPCIVMASTTIIKLDRYFLIPIIIFILWAGVSLDKISILLSRISLLGRPAYKGRPWVILSILAIILSLNPLLNAVRYDRMLGKKDTRLIAGEWIKKNISAHSHLAIFSRHPWANPPIDAGKYKITSIPLVYKNRDRDREIFKLRFARSKAAVSFIKNIFNEEFSPELFQKRIDSLTPIEDFIFSPLSHFKEKGVGYIVVSGFLKDDLLDKATARHFPKLYSSSCDFFDELEKEARLVYSLPVMKRFGRDYGLSPAIEIYSLKIKPAMIQ